MPKKRNNQTWSYKPQLPVTPPPSEKRTRSVNDILANLRRTPGSPSSPASHAGNTPSVPPDIRQILQIPDGPQIAPRRPVRARFDANGRRLPAGPPPPMSWVRQRDEDLDGTGSGSGSGTSTPGTRRLPDPPGTWQTALPGARLPARGSLMDLVLRNVAVDWDLQRVYNVFHLYFLPGHVKPALIRFIGFFGAGVTPADLRLLLLPPPADLYGEDEEPVIVEADEAAAAAREVTYMDLGGSLGRTIKVKELADLLFPPAAVNPATQGDAESASPSDSWLEEEEQVSSLPTGPVPRGLLPNLTHLSLALDPGCTDASSSRGVSWRQLLSLASRASGLTHLSLAYWPAPCLAPRAAAQSATLVVSRPGGDRHMAYGGSNMYSHTLDDDWSEALLVLRMLSRSLYELEFLDLTGCAPWWAALTARADHDYVDWAAAWSKIVHLRLRPGWTPAPDAMPSDRMAHEQALEDAARVEKHIRAMRAGQGRFITVEK